MSYLFKGFLQEVTLLRNSFDLLLFVSVTAVSGFPKPGSAYNIDNILKGQIGDDAYFVARHVDQWTTSEFGEDVPASTDNPSGAGGDPDNARGASAAPGNADVIGVADGVGGWRAYGVDPGQFSSNLMKCCERLVVAGYFNGCQPASLLAQVKKIYRLNLFSLNVKNVVKLT